MSNELTKEDLEDHATHTYMPCKACEKIEFIDRAFVALTAFTSIDQAMYVAEMMWEARTENHKQYELMPNEVDEIKAKTTAP